MYFPRVMFPNRNRVFQTVIFSLILTALLASCQNKSKPIEADPAFAPYIDAYTTGVISKTSSIRIQLAGTVLSTHTIGQPVKEDLFSFSPSVKGKAVWTDARTIEFRPDKHLDPDQLYTVSFELGKAAKVPDKFNTFRFSFKTTKPAFLVRQTGLRSTGDRKGMYLTGEISTADWEEGAKVEKMLEAKQYGQTKTISWQHSEGNRLHTFTIRGIERIAQTSSLDLNWKGSFIGSAKTGKLSVEVPAQGVFSILEVMPVNEAQQYASILFSDPISIAQDLTGLISLSEQSDISYSINGSEVKVFTNAPLDGNYTLNINPGIANNWGQTISNVYTSSIFFESRFPSVAIIGKGNILPSSGKLVIPFDAVNLNAVDVSIIRIYENNIPQFFQENDLGGGSELRRVGKPVVQKTLRLDNDQALDLHKKQRFSLDIDRFIKTEPGAIYRVVIGFRPEYSLYSKTGNEPVADSENGDSEADDEDEEGYNDYSGYDDKDSDSEFWARYDDYYPYGYNWQRRNDPGSRSYYNRDRWAIRNILASNIGLTAKRGTDNSVVIAVSNILTTEPMKGISLDILDYQLQVIATGKSDNDGFATFDLKQKPYLLIAKKDKERGYLKLNDGSSLALSRFDVGGEEVKNGIKGFIFGERGVWRPGDSLFLNCIIEDRNGTLPAEHPVDFSLINPQGQIYRHAVQQNAADGFYAFSTNTDASAPTGNYTARVKVGGAVFEKKIKIETVMPNRLKINLDFGKDAYLGKNSPNTGNLQAAWLFGAPGKNLKAKVDVSLNKSRNPFPGLAGFIFQNPTSSFSTQQKTIFEGTLDENGHGQIKPDFAIDDDAPGMLNANLLVKVFEPGGSFSVDYMSVPYSPFSSYAGLKLPDGEKPFDYLLAGKQHSVQLVNVNAKGQLLTNGGAMEVQFYRIQWRWWWDEGDDNLSNFTQDNYNKLLKKDTVNLTGGRGRWTFSTSSNEWGRYLVLVKDLASGHITGSTLYIDEPGWQSRSGNEDQSAASMLSFSSNKDKYTVGEEVKLSIPSSAGGRILVSLESGSRVIRHFWQETVQGQTTVSFKADESMAPNIYATVSLLQPHAQTLNDAPIRMYGSIPIIIENKNSYLKPVINMPEVIRPEQNVSITVSEENGKEMTYCVAMVDEGLLDLTKFKTPDPHGAFYAREALGVRSFDLFNDVIGAWGGDLERILTIGGDAESGGGKAKRANRFKPVVRYFGPFTLKSGQKKQHQFLMPAYIGSVRTMVVAAHKGAYGSSEKTTPVRKPLMILSTLPRVLAPGESFRLPVTVFAMEKQVSNVQVNLQPNEFFEITGNAVQMVSFAQPGEQMVYFDVKVKNTAGVGKVKVLASSGQEKATDITEIDVRNPNPVISRSQSITLAPGQSWNATANPLGIPSQSQAMLEISSIPPMNLQKRLQYLITYPHGCIEQTTSSVFPQLVLKQLTDLNDQQKAEIDRNIKASIPRLANFQGRDGGFGYWPGARESDDWGTNYAGHFLLEAQGQGYFVSDQLMQQWKNYQRNKANNWIPKTTNFYGGDLTQAYRLFTLALAKAPELGAMNRLREFRYRSAEATWRLAAAYKLAGQDNTALDLISGLSSTFDARPDPGMSYGSDLRDMAMALETLTIMGKRDKASQLVTSIAGRLSQESWYSTQTTAYSLLAIARYCGKNPSGEKILASVNLAGNKSDIQSQSYFRQVMVPLQKGNIPVGIRNNGKNTLYVRLVSTGQPLTGDSIKPANNPSLLSMTVSYIGNNGSPLDISHISQGSDFIAKVTIRNNGKRGTYSQMALTQAFPSGWEILNARMMAEGESAMKSSQMTYQDIRDDRVMTYFNIRENETLTYYIQLNATYPGKYYLPATTCEAMYDNSITASTGGRWIEVVNQ